MIRLAAVIGLFLLSGCVGAIPPTVEVIAGIAASGTTTMLNAPKVYDEVQSWVDSRALVLPPQPVAVLP